MTYFPYSFWTSSFLRNNLLSFYTFNNCDDIGKDNASIYDLTTNGVIDCTVGKLGNSAQNNTVSASMTIPDPDGIFDLTTDKTISFWVKFTNASVSPNILGKYSLATEYWIILSSPNIDFNIGTTAGSFSVTSTQTITNDTWFHVVVQHIISTKKIRIQINNGEIFENTYTGNPSTSGQDFEALIPNIGFEYTTDSLGIWSRILTAQEISFLYNNGNGREYPFNIN